MYIIKKTADLQDFLSKTDGTTGFVPTMGALHEGHLSLLRQSMEQEKTTVCSIFVNPTQFNDPSDYEKYPVTLETDIEQLALAGVDVLFLPVITEMYPGGIIQSGRFDLGYLDTVLDGAFRPGHFNGVCTVVQRLLEAVRPNRIYMGEKDFQQCLVVRRLLNLVQSPVELITCPTLREANGLAMSSRNTRLSAPGRQQASAIFRCLAMIRENMQDNPFPSIQTKCKDELAKLNIDTEYLLLADALTLELLPEFDLSRKMVVLIACMTEGVRLIDNLRLND